jgi:hypothetical protein
MGFPHSEEAVFDPIDAMGDLFDSVLEGSLDSLDAGVDAVDSALDSVAGSIDSAVGSGVDAGGGDGREETAGEETAGAVEDRSRPVVIAVGMRGRRCPPGSSRLTPVGRRRRVGEEHGDGRGRKGHHPERRGDAEVRRPER